MTKHRKQTLLICVETHPGSWTRRGLKRRLPWPFCLSQKCWPLFSLLSPGMLSASWDAVINQRLLSRYCLCQTPQDALYQPLNLVYVSGRSQTRKIPPIHQFLLLLLFGKTTLNSKNKCIWGSFSWRWKDTKKWAGPWKMVMVRKGDNLCKKISISDVDYIFWI